MDTRVLDIRAVTTATKASMCMNNVQNKWHISLLYHVYKHGMLKTFTDTFLKLENSFLLFSCTSCPKCNFFHIQTNLNLQTITGIVKILACPLLSIRKRTKSKHLAKECECSEIDSKKKSSVSQYMSSDFLTYRLHALAFDPLF